VNDAYMQEICAIDCLVRVESLQAYLLIFFIQLCCCCYW